MSKTDRWHLHKLVVFCVILQASCLPLTTAQHAGTSEPGLSLVGSAATALLSSNWPASEVVQRSSSHFRTRRKLTQWDFNECLSGSATVVQTSMAPAPGSSSSSEDGADESLPAGAALTVPPQALRGASSEVLAALQAKQNQSSSSQVATNANVGTTGGTSDTNDGRSSSLLATGGQGLTNDTISSSNSSGSSDSSSSKQGATITPRSICPLDPPFMPSTASRTTCRLFINIQGANKTQGYTRIQCTAWFYSKNQVVTAGHCIAAGGRYTVKRSQPGYMCCGFTESGKCKTGRKWALRKWVTTTGYMRGELPSNDGALIEVAPWNPSQFVRGIPQPLMSFYPGPVPAHNATLDGYPANATSDVGCNVDPFSRYETAGEVQPLTLTGAGGVGVDYALPGCSGQSGGRVMFEGKAYGLQNYGERRCLTGQGLTGVTQLTLKRTECGVCIPCLARALDKA